MAPQMTGGNIKSAHHSPLVAPSHHQLQAVHIRKVDNNHNFKRLDGLVASLPSNSSIIVPDDHVLHFTGGYFGGPLLRDTSDTSNRRILGVYRQETISFAIKASVARDFVVEALDSVNNFNARPSLLQF